MSDRHYLTLLERDESGEWDYDVEHPVECPVSRAPFGTNNKNAIILFDCEVGRILREAGLEEAFDVGSPDTPGTYPIESYFYEYSTPDGLDCETSLRLTGPAVVSG
jgi:hypothetical protein